MEDKFRYMIFRTYTEEERDDYRDRNVFYGWTRYKSVKKAFMSQRDNSKYKCVKMYEEDIVEIYSEDIVDDDTMIDFVMLQSKNLGKDIPIFITVNELRQYEEKLQTYFVDLCSLRDFHQVMIFANIDKYYADALDYIGFRPENVESMFSTHDGLYGIDLINQNLEMAYEGLCGYPVEAEKNNHDIPGRSYLEDVSKKIIYSLESFIKILKDDL